MGQELVRKISSSLTSMEWPQTPVATAHGWQTYKIGMEKALAYKDDPKDLSAAIRTFQTGDSRPYAYAGAAFVLIQAAREKDGSYASDGLSAAMKWLERAQEMEPDNVSINMIEALVYTYHGRFEDARVVLDYLAREDPENQYLHLAEIAFWRHQGNVAKTVAWFHRAVENSVTVPERLGLRRQLGDFFFETQHMNEALEVYAEAVQFSPEDTGLWHKLSLIYWQQENYEEASRCNQRALRINDTPTLRKMEKALKKKLAGPGFIDKLFGS